VQIGALGHVLLQHRKREVVTCPQGQNLVPLVARIGKHAAQVGAQGLYVGLHPCARPALGPDEALCELCRPCLLPLGPGDERLTQCLFPLAERSPCVAIRSAECLGGMTDRAVLHDRREQLEQRITELRSALLAGLENVPQM
jgi:hypothetical protein